MLMSKLVHQVTGGIGDKELNLIMNRSMDELAALAKKGQHYEIVEHAASSLIGNIEEATTS